ncbi:MAG TPA: general stress protein [Acidobacteriaceae bacterium]|nr:general stress protein [Acidobacteriaceae bacterium]
MSGKNTAVFGIYMNVAQAEQAADRLIASGFDNQDISVLMADNDASHQFAHEKNTKAPEGATTGVATGGVIGGTLGVLAGIGALAIPGVGPLIAAGPIMAGLAGLGIGGAVGGLIGALVGMGIPEYEAKRYEGRVRDGGVLLSAHCGSSEEISRAKDILRATGAEDIASSGEKSGRSSGSERDRTQLDRTTSTPAFPEDRSMRGNGEVPEGHHRDLVMDRDREVASDSTLEPLVPVPSAGGPDPLDPLEPVSSERARSTTRTRVF